MATLHERQKNFAAALITWLRSDATLVTLVGSTNTNICVASIDVNVPIPNLLVTIAATTPMYEIDRLFESSIMLNANATDRVTAMNIIGRAQEFASSSSSATMNTISAAFSGTGVQTMRIQSGTLTIGNPDDTLEPDIYRTFLSLSVWWRDA